MIIGNLDASLSSGLAETDAASVKQLKFDLKEGILEPLVSAYSFFDPQTGTIGAAFLWHLIGTVYRAGQVTPNAMIAEDILGPEIARKADSKRGASGGKRTAEKRKPKVDAKATPRNKRVMLRFWVSEARLCNSILDGMRRL